MLTAVNVVWLKTGSAVPREIGAACGGRATVGFGILRRQIYLTYWWLMGFKL